MSLPYDRNALRGRVAVVAGATRGAGRGIAAALGEAGAIVICTGRTSRIRAIASDYDRNETIEETGELVTSLGGKGIAVATDHLLANEVKTLAERLQSEFGKIDILVNDIWSAELLWRSWVTTMTDTKLKYNNPQITPITQIQIGYTN